MKKRHSTVPWVGKDETPSFNWKKHEETLCHLIEALSESLKIALLIPEILENSQAIFQCLTDSEYKQAIEIINDFLRVKEKCPPEEIPTHLDSATNSLIDYFINNSGILRYIPKVVKKLNPNELKLLSYLEMIKDIAGENLSKTALASVKLKSNINQTQGIIEDLENYKGNMRKEIVEAKSRKSVVQRPEPPSIKIPSHDEIQNAQDYTVEEISKVRQFHAIAEKDLQEKLKAKKSLYEGNVKMHMGTEKRARVELNKRILQLQELCKTYDQMMLQKMQEETFLNNRCEKLKKDVDKFQIEFDRVEEIYNEFAARANEKNRFRVASRAVRKIKYWYEDRLKRRDKAALRGAKTQGKNTKTAEAGVKTKKSKKK